MSTSTSTAPRGTSGPAHPAHQRHVEAPGPGQRDRLADVRGRVRRRRSVPSAGSGSPRRGSSAASARTVVTPRPRSRSASSPRTTRLTSSVRRRSASQTGHHGQRRHSVMREGSASAGAPVRAAVGDGEPVGEAPVVGVERAASDLVPGRRGEVGPDHAVGIEADDAAPGGPGRDAQTRGGEHPVQVGEPQDVARDRAHLALGVRGRRRRVRPGERGGQRAGPGVGDPVAHDDHGVPAPTGARGPDEQLGVAPPAVGRAAARPLRGPRRRRRTRARASRPPARARGPSGTRR